MLASGGVALLVGAGGAGSAIADEMLARGAAHLKVHDIDATRRDRIIGRVAVEARRIGCATMPGAGMVEAQAQLLVDRMLEMEAI